MLPINRGVPSPGVSETPSPECGQPRRFRSLMPPPSPVLENAPAPEPRNRVDRDECRAGSACVHTGTVDTAEQLLAGFAIYDQNAHPLKMLGILNCCWSD